MSLWHLNYVKVLCLKMPYSLPENGFIPYTGSNIYVKIVNWSDPVNRHTRHSVCNSCVVEIYYWALLKLFAVCTICKQSHQNKKDEYMALSSEILHHHCVHLWRLTIADMESFVADKTRNTIDNDSLSQYIYSQAYSQTKQNNIVHDQNSLTCLKLMKRTFLCHMSKHGHRLQREKLCLTTWIV